MAQRQLRGAAAQAAAPQPQAQPAPQPAAAVAVAAPPAPQPAAPGVQVQPAPQAAQPVPAPGAQQPAPPVAPVRAWATPDKFTGARDSDWPSWLLQFETVSQVNNWTPQHQVAYLGLYLSGAALSYYHSLDANVRQGPLPQLLQLMEQRFNAPQQADMYRAELQGRRQRPGEPLSDYCEAIRRLARYSYPTLQPAVQDTLGKDQFIAGLDSRDLRVQVRTVNPATLDDALQRALHMQTILQTDSQSDGLVERMNRTLAAM
eukprot:scpid61627/ scgid18287/ 